MKRIVVSCLVLSAFLLICAGCSKQKDTSTVAEVREGKPVPDITVSSLTNTPLKLSELKGKVVLLNFWATWCPPCREEIPSMMKLNSAMAGKPFQMVTISIDEGGVPDIEAFFKDTKFTLPTYTDPGGTAQKIYGVTGVPETFVIDKNGVLVKKVIGPLAWDAPQNISYLEGLMK